MVLLSVDETIVWQRFHEGKSTSEIAEEGKQANSIVWKRLYESTWLRSHKEKSLPDISRYSERSILEEVSRKTEKWSSSYVSRVLNRARKKIEKVLREHATSHRLDIESVRDYQGQLRGYDYQTSSPVFLIFTVALGVVVWYKHMDWAGKLCPDCPKQTDCRETLDTIIKEYKITLRPDEESRHMTEQSIAIFDKLMAKEIPRYKRKDETKEVGG